MEHLEIWELKNQCIWRGQRIKPAVGFIDEEKLIDLSYTDPYFLDSDIAAGIDLFNIRRNNKIYSDISII